MITPAEDDPRLAGIAGGARQCIGRYQPLELRTLTPPDNGPAALNDAAQEALRMQPGAVCVCVAAAETAREAVGALVGRGTTVVTIGDRVDVAGVYGHVRVDWAGGAALLGRQLEQVAGGSRSYLLLHWSSASQEARDCYLRFMAEARASPSLTLLDEADVGSGEPPAAQTLRALLARFPYAGVVITLAPSPWLDERPGGMLGRNTRCATLGAPPPLWRCLSAGEATALVGPIDGALGAAAVELALAGMTQSVRAGQVRTVECELVTAATLEDFATRYAQAAGLDVRGTLERWAGLQPATDAVAPGGR